MIKAKEDLLREMQEGEPLSEEEMKQRLEKISKNINLKLPTIKTMDGFADLPEKMATADLKKEMLRNDKMMEFLREENEELKRENRKIAEEQTKEIIKAQKEGEKKGIMKVILIEFIVAIASGLILTFIS